MRPWGSARVPPHGCAGTEPDPSPHPRQVHYTGTLSDGTVFDSSFSRGEPTEFKLNSVIQGWQEGLQLMRAGQRVQGVCKAPQLACPSCPVCPVCPVCPGCRCLRRPSSGGCTWRCRQPAPKLCRGFDEQHRTCLPHACHMHTTCMHALCMYVLCMCASGGRQGEADHTGEPGATRAEKVVTPRHVTLRSSAPPPVAASCV